MRGRILSLFVLILSLFASVSEASLQANFYAADASPSAPALIAILISTGSAILNKDALIQLQQQLRMQASSFVGEQYSELAIQEALQSLGYATESGELAVSLVNEGLGKRHLLEPEQTHQADGGSHVGNGG